MPSRRDAQLRYAKYYASTPGKVDTLYVKGDAAIDLIMPGFRRREGLPVRFSPDE